MKKSAPKIQESAQERTLRQHGAQLSTEASRLNSAFAARAAKVAAADNTSVVTTAASGTVAKSLADRLKTATTGDQRVAAILGANSAGTALNTQARATGRASTINNLTANVKRGLGVTGSVLSSLSSQAQSAQNASEIDVQSRMDAQAAKMKALGSAISAGIDYKTGLEQKAQNQEYMNLLRKSTGGP